MVNKLHVIQLSKCTGKQVMFLSYVGKFDNIAASTDIQLGWLAIVVIVQ